MPTILDNPPGYVAAHLAALIGALDQPADQGGVPAKDSDELLLATWNLREFARFTPKWRSGPGDSPVRDLRSLLFIATILERFDVIASKSSRTPPTPCAPCSAGSTATYRPGGASWSPTS